MQISFEISSIVAIIFDLGVLYPLGRLHQNLKQGTNRVSLFVFNSFFGLYFFPSGFSNTLLTSLQNPLPMHLDLFPGSGNGEEKRDFFFRMRVLLL